MAVNYLCHVCGSYFKTPVRQCPMCGSVERHRVLRRMLSLRSFGRIRIFGMRVLVVNPTRAERKILAEYGVSKITSLDIRPEAKPDVLADIMDMPQVADESFDMVIASFVLCMTQDHKRAIAEFNRVLAPGGLLLTSDPIRGGKTIEFQGDKITAHYGADTLAKHNVGHFRHFGLEDLMRDLRDPKLEVHQETMKDPITGTPVTWCASRKPDTAKTRVLRPANGIALSKMQIIPQRRRNKFLSVETSVPTMPSGFRNVRFGDHAHGQVLCYGTDSVLLSHDLGETWEAHATPEIEGANIMSAFIGSDFYLLQSIGLSDGLEEPQGGWARIYAYDKDWRFMGSSAVAKSHWHGSWSIDQHEDTVMWGTYCVNSDKYKTDYKTNPDRYADTVFPNRIFRSRDRGLTWECVLEIPVSDVRHIHCVQHDPFAPGTWWASTGDFPQECRLYRSTDDGDSWQDLTGAMPPVYTEAKFPFPKQAAYRFTAFSFTEKGLFWPSDDWLGDLSAYNQTLPIEKRAGSRLFFMPRTEGADIEEVAYLGYAARSMTDVGKGWVVTTESKYPEIGIRPQVFYVPKNAPDEASHLFDVDNYAWRGTGFTYARASRVAEQGIFFSFRQMTDGFNSPVKAMRWRIEAD